jgi:hypothetical protein
MASSKTKLKSNGDRASPCFKPLLIGHLRQILAHPDSAVRFSQTHFYWPYWFLGDTKLNENIIQGSQVVLTVLKDRCTF